MIEHLKHEDINLGIIIRRSYSTEGIDFFTQDEDPLQLGYMKREKDYSIEPHVHNPVERLISFTHEVLYIKSGKVRVDFYTNEKKYLRSILAESGDVLLLMDGGHGFKMLEESEIIEVKQGPYVGNRDKTRFTSVEDSKVIV